MAGGGSGGHLFPGLAVAEALRENDARAEILFLATERNIDERILAACGFDYLTQPVVPLPRQVGQVWDFWRRWRASVRMARKLMAQKPPAIVLGLGGFASGPALKVAAQSALPSALLNPDALPGRANRYARRSVDRIFVQFQTSIEYFGNDAHKCIVTGCPIRKALVESTGNSHPDPQTSPSAQKLLGLDPSCRRTLVVMGGSQGGKNVNDAVLECLTGPDVSFDDWQVLHLTGPADKESTQQAYREAPITAQVISFTDRMDLVLAVADLLITRAGASSLAELTAAGVPSILLPYPYHRDQHQMRNAQVLAQAGAARIVVDQCDAKKTAKGLYDVLTDIINNDKLTPMAEAAAKLAQPHAARTVADALTSLARDRASQDNN